MCRQLFGVKAHPLVLRLAAPIHLSTLVMCATEQPCNNNNRIVARCRGKVRSMRTLHCLRKHNGTENDSSYVGGLPTPAEFSSTMAYHQSTASVLDVASNDE